VKDAAVANLKTNSMMMTLFWGGNDFQFIFIHLDGSNAIGNILLGLEVHSYVILFSMMGCVFILGMFIDCLGILLIVVPIFTLIALELDFGPVWFATLICVNLQRHFDTTLWLFPVLSKRLCSQGDVHCAHLQRRSVLYRSTMGGTDHLHSVA
jgi:TRAP-type mannitol/chloroaromatic compound transport system permease large subunit